MVSLVDSHCLVICGGWKCSTDGEWNVEIDKLRWSRVVRVRAGITVSEFVADVGKEFGMEGVPATLSYWSPNSMQLMTGKKTPPVVVNTDVGLAYFLEMLRSNKQLNLFVKFEDDMKTGLRGTDTGERSSPEHGSNKRWCGDVSTAGSKNKPMVCEDDELIQELEKVEATIGAGRGPIVSEVNRTSSGEDGKPWDEDLDEDIDEWGQSDEEVTPCDEEVAPVVYDKEFWSSFLQEQYIGANVVEVMCTSNDAFDHTVVLNGDVKGEEMLNPSASKSVAKAGQGYDGHEVSGHFGSGQSSGFKWTSSSGRSSGSRHGVETQKLEDIDDEEFDIPPMFDDLEYEVDDIPDLDLDEGGKGIYRGKVYGSKDDCQIGLAIYAIKNMFTFWQSRTRRYSFVVSCTDPNCHWRVMAHEMKHNEYYQIRKVYLKHTCSIETRGKFRNKASSRVIAAMYKQKFSDPNNAPRPSDLQQLVLEDLRVSASYWKCWRAKEKAVDDVIGTDDESYEELAVYLHALKMANPDSVTDIKTVKEEDGSERFLYMFLSFGASIQGFRKLRRVLVVDGTHLTGKYKGVLLTASGQDANFQVFPLAFAIVDSENDDAWRWFFQKLERIIADSVDLTIISDRNQSIYKAKKEVFPLSHHGACIVHIKRNVIAKFKSQGLGKMVVDAGFAYKVSKFKELYKEIKSKSNECAKYLEDIGMAHWTRVYFWGNRYNLMTSNIAETLNNALTEGRGSQIIELLKFIRSMLTRWFSARRRKSSKHRGPVPPEVDKQMTNNLKDVKGSKIGNVSSWSYEIVGLYGSKHHVLLDGKSCTCKQYDRLKIPCGHALLAADNKEVAYGTLVGDCYKTATWAATYEGVINPELDPKELEIPPEVANLKLMPPRSRRPSGRPKASRIPSVGEFPKAKSARSTSNRCGRCRGIGHNKTKCTNPI